MEIQEQIEPFLRKSNQNVLGIGVARACTNPRGTARLRRWGYTLRCHECHTRPHVRDADETDDQQP